jgi:hypothetical protein
MYKPQQQLRIIKDELTTILMMMMQLGVIGFNYACLEAFVHLLIQELRHNHD